MLRGFFRLTGALALLASSTQCDQTVGDDVSTGDAAGEATNDASTSTADATSSPIDFGFNVASEESIDADTDVSSDAIDDLASDAIADVSGDATSSDASGYCGDGVRDPLTEECDDAVISQLTDSCTSMCTVRDVLAYQTPTDASAVQRTLGMGRHPIGADGNGFAVAWVEPSIPDIFATFYDAKGVPSGHVDHVGVSSTCLTSSSPVLAAISGKYAAAWTDYGGDGDGAGIAIRLVDPSTSSTGAPSHANQTTSFSQYHPDILWTGTQLVVAWEDTSNSSTGPDLRYRTFSSTLSPTSNEQTLAGTAAIEQDVALATFGTGWVAAWRSSSGGAETIIVKASSSIGWSVGPFLPGPYESAPSLTQIDATHLLLVYSEGVDPTDSGVANQSIIRGALLDTAHLGSVTPFDITTIAQQDAGASPSAFFPNVIGLALLRRVGNRCSNLRPQRRRSLVQRSRMERFVPRPDSRRETASSLGRAPKR